MNIHNENLKYKTQRYFWVEGTPLKHTVFSHWTGGACSVNRLTLTEPSPYQDGAWGFQSTFHKISMHHGANVSNGAHMSPASARQVASHKGRGHLGSMWSLRGPTQVFCEPRQYGILCKSDSPRDEPQKRDLRMFGLKRLFSVSVVSPALSSMAAWDTLNGVLKHDPN